VLEKMNIYLELGKSFLYNIKKYAKFQIYKKYLPANPVHDDIYVVEFPKSGVTWLSFLIANIFIESEKEELTFYNHHKYVVDVHQLRNHNIKNRVFNSCNSIFIKSHSMYNPYYSFVIYLMRNPFDVMLSYYYFMLKHGLNIDFSDFVKHNKYGIGVWKRHVEGWLIKNKNLAQRIHLIQYENLIDNTKTEIEKIFTNLGIKINKTQILFAIENSSKDKMKLSESFYFKNSPTYNKSGLNFIRKGEKYQKDEMMTPEIRKYISKETENILKEFYPDLLIS
jgi:sulfotransferase family protein